MHVFQQQQHVSLVAGYEERCGEGMVNITCGGHDPEKMELMGRNERRDERRDEKRRGEKKISYSVRRGR